MCMKNTSDKGKYIGECVLDYFETHLEAEE